MTDIVNECIKDYFDLMDEITFDNFRAIVHIVIYLLLPFIIIILVLSFQEAHNNWHKHLMMGSTCGI